jgi:elongation factor Ts
MSEVKISAADVNKLRQATGAGMMDCKKALVEAEGDFNAAIDYLRKKGQKVAANRADREAKEGVCLALTSGNRNKGLVFKLNCETDFVAKNEGFVNLANEIGGILLDKLPNSEEEAVALRFNDSMTIAEKLVEQTGVIGEKIEISGYAKIETAAGEGQVLPYVHMGNRAAVIVALNLEGLEYMEAGRSAAMQVAAMRPVAVDKDGVNATMIEKEIEIGKELARQEGKPEAMLDKIAQGRLEKFYKENTLLNQQFVKDSSFTVGSYLKSLHKNLTVTAFKHVSLG